MTIRIPEGDGEPDSIGIKLPSGVTVVPDKNIVGGVYPALVRLADIESVLGEEYDLDYLDGLLSRNPST